MELGRQDLQRDGSLHRGLMGAIYDAHATLAEDGLDPISAESVTWLEHARSRVRDLCGDSRRRRAQYPSARGRVLQI